LSVFYRGMLYYGLTQALFMAIEFGLFESVLHWLESGSSASEEAKIKEHSNMDILLASVLASTVGATLTNPFEIMAVNRQGNPNFKIGSLLKEKNPYYSMLTRGLQYRVIYFTSQACIFFFLLHETSMFLKVDISTIEQ